MVELSVAKAHMSLNVADLSTSIEFYRVLFGQEPAKCHDDYAKFELDVPPVVFSLQPGPRPPGASLSHIGLRFRSQDDVLAIQNRLSSAEIPFSRQQGVVCGYARQSKCWVSDPDNNYWEIYVLEADVDPSRMHACLTQLVPGESDMSSEVHEAIDIAPLDESVEGGGANRHVLYRGPFREVIDRAGRVFRRGRRTAVGERTFNELRTGPLAEQFLFAVNGAVGTCGGDNQPRNDK